MSPFRSEVYSTREIALAAGVPHERVVAAIGRSDLFLGHDEAVRLGRSLVGGDATLRSNFSTAHPSAAPPTLFSSVTEVPVPGHSKGVSLAVSSTVHAGVIAGAIFLATFGMNPKASALATESLPAETSRLVYLNIPGPSGGGGGGGLRQPTPAPKALREGRKTVSSPVPLRRPLPRVEPVVAPPEPPPAPLEAEPLPILVAPIVSAPADDRNRVGVIEQTKAEVPSHGPGQGGGAGTGTGAGLGSGDGSGIGPGSGGGTGGGPFRPGSGIEPPRLLREVKADYSEDARRRGLEGEVVMEIVVTQNGSVGNVRILKKLGAGLDELATQAVRQWRFAPATRKGSPVDVLVEVAVEFKLR
jgi:periplasmic protein TonB